MIQLSKEFAECLISASHFAVKTPDVKNVLRYVSIKMINRGHGICGTDGFVLGSYEITEDNCEQIEGYADFSNVKIKKGSVVTSASVASISGLYGILINLRLGRKNESTFVPVVRDLVYPDYEKILNYNPHTLSGGKQYGKWQIDPSKFHKILNCLNYEAIDIIGIRPTQESDQGYSDNALECDVHIKEQFNVKAGTFNIPGETIHRESIIEHTNDGSYMVSKNSPRYFNPEILTRTMREASTICKGNISIGMADILDPVHIKGFSDGSSYDKMRQEIYAHYLVMPMNRG